MKVPSTTTTYACWTVMNWSLDLKTKFIANKIQLLNFEIKIRIFFLILYRVFFSELVRRMRNVPFHPLLNIIFLKHEIFFIELNISNILRIFLEYSNIRSYWYSVIMILYLHFIRLIIEFGDVHCFSVEYGH